MFSDGKAAGRLRWQGFLKTGRARRTNRVGANGFGNILWPLLAKVGEIDSELTLGLHVAEMGDANAAWLRDRPEARGDIDDFAEDVADRQRAAFGCEVASQGWSEAARQLLLDPGCCRVAGVGAQGRNVDPDIADRETPLRQRGPTPHHCEERKRAASRNRGATVALRGT
jgi:hypothetical protein